MCRSNSYFIFINISNEVSHNAIYDNMERHKNGLDNEAHWDDVINFLADGIATLIKVFKPLLGEAVKD